MVAQTSRLHSLADADGRIHGSLADQILWLISLRWFAVVLVGSGVSTGAVVSVGRGTSVDVELGCTDIVEVAVRIWGGLRVPVVVAEGAGVRVRIGVRGGGSVRTGVSVGVAVGLSCVSWLVLVGVLKAVSKVLSGVSEAVGEKECKKTPFPACIPDATWVPNRSSLEGVSCDVRVGITKTKSSPVSAGVP